MVKKKNLKPERHTIITTDKLTLSI